MKYLSIILTLLSSSICFAHRDLETGTFLPRDPIGYSDGQSVYCYVNCNPICAVYETYETRPFEWSDGSTGNPDPQRANTKDEEAEAELGLLNEGMRYRDLETGTFLTRDPIGYADGPNIYCYVHSNPITSFDPLGLDNDLFSEFDLYNQSIQNSVPPGISCNIDGSSYGVYNPGQSMIDRIFSPIENSVEGAWSVATNPRVQGGVQFLGGLTQGLAGGTATYGSGGTATWGGVFLMGHGVDDMQAGWQKLWSGQYADTATHQALAGLAEAVPGVSADAANTFATFAEMTAAGLAAFNVAGQQMQRAASELSYTANPAVSTTPVD